ncbi:alpha/beta fold hydrolase [Chelativorans salis]|uniref:Alpha/beta hydrolase n=1 Tax=Chelativorans salis TaxID=2978478 RepID=A0ABT2LVA1_9HYPH|nr:alpha/beta hydrolase [Chelativorans sp. EGI FJ00035]MCT7377503.1 alpha/beta hydrolase [Chelativorans sp. EGI FJ00035]
MSDLLREIPENPLPKSAVAGMMTGDDGVRIRYAHFPCRAENGTVVLLQGRNESIEKYFETVGDLAKRGFAAATLDWRGQGGSDRLLPNAGCGHIETFDDYVADLDRFFTEIVLPDCRPPYTVLAHSTGALIALLASPHLASRVSRMVLLAPLFTFIAPLPLSLVRAFTSTYFACGLGSRPVPGAGRRGAEIPFAANRLTSDSTRYTRNEALLSAHPELAVANLSTAWLRAAFTAAERVREREFMAGIRLPILFLAASADRVVSTPAIERYAKGLRSAHVLTIDGARHELLQEADLYREQVLAAFEAFARPSRGGGIQAPQPTADAG